MSRGSTAPVQQQDTDRIAHLLEAILAELKKLNRPVSQDPTP